MARVFVSPITPALPDDYPACPGLPSVPEIDLIEHYGLATSFGTATGLERLRQEVFRRTIDAGSADAVIGGFYVDREIYGATNDKLALYRYLLEPLGIALLGSAVGSVIQCGPSGARLKILRIVN